MRGRSSGDGALRWAAFVLAPAWLVQFAAPRAEATIAYDVYAGANATDNVRLTQTERRADVISTVGFDLDWREERRLIETDVLADLSYLDYARGSFSPGVVGNFLGLGRFNLIPEKFSWMVSDNFGQEQINPLTPVTPENRENVNYLSTGPNLTLPLGSAAEFLLDGRYSKVSYQKSDLGSNRYSGTVGVLRQLSSSSSVSVEVEDQLNRFDNSILNPDYDEQQAYFHYNKRGVRTRFDGQVGYARLKLRDGTTTGEPMARVELTRQLSPRTSVVLTGGHEYSDAADDFRLQQALGGANLATQAVQPTGIPFKNNYVTLGLKYQRDRTGVGLDFGHYGMSYIQHFASALAAALDERRNTVALNGSRRLTPLLDAQVSLIYERDSFDESINTSQFFTGTAQLNWRMTQRFGLSFMYAYTRRESNLPAGSYYANILWLRVTYGRVAQVPTGSVVPRLPVLPNQTGY